MTDEFKYVGEKTKVLNALHRYGAKKPMLLSDIKRRTKIEYEDLHVVMAQLTRQGAVIEEFAGCHICYILVRTEAKI